MQLIKFSAGSIDFDIRGHVADVFEATFVASDLRFAISKHFAEKSGGRFVAVAGGTAMREAFKNIVSELGTQYTLGFQPANTSKDGKWHTLEVQVAKPNLTIRTRKGYNAPKK